MKIMSHVIEYSVFYPCCEYEIRKSTSSSPPLCLGRSHKPTRRAWSLYGGDNKTSDTSPTGCNRRRGKLKIFLNLRAYIEGGKRLPLWAYRLNASWLVFRDSKSYCYESTGRAWNLYGGESQKSDTSPTGCPQRRRKLGIFLSPRACTERERLEFFQV